MRRARCSAAGRARRCRPRAVGSAAADAAHRHHRQAGRRADGNPRRSAGDSAEASRFIAWDLAVKILGGEGANRLHQVLRSQRGLTYGASADTDAMKDAGDYVAETDTRTDTTGEALRLMVDEFSRLQRQRVFERELADAQAYLAGSFPLTIETPERHRDAGAQRRVLRPAGRGPGHLSANACWR